MNLLDYKKQFLNKLEKEYPRSEMETFFHWLAEAYLKLNRLQIALDPALKINPLQKEKFDTALVRLENHEPIQYIIGECDFYGMTFHVDPAVLIPRPETEELVDWILKETYELSELQILDIGTGSGCIAISLAKNLPNSQIFALDISESALKIASENSVANGVKVKFLQEDIFKIEKLSEKIDIIVSNPPYVREAEKAEMKQNVLNHEPKTALYVTNEDPLIFYRKILEFSKNNLREKGHIFMEINQYLGRETAELFQQEGFKTELWQDMFGKDRMLKAWK